jgi:hypothetical protein
MTWATDRLPIVLPPLPGEALDSWIEAYACRLRTSSTGLLRFLSLPGIAAKHLVFRLEEADLKALARLTDADASELDRMTAVRRAIRPAAAAPAERGRDGPHLASPRAPQPLLPPLPRQQRGPLATGLAARTCLTR